jgi:hypothetical protein
LAGCPAVARRSLSRAEREVILLRFFERKSFREIGNALGKTDDAAQKQTERALEKLSEFLKRKGVSVPVAVLSTGLTAQFTQAAPRVLTHAISQGALTAASTFDAKLFILKTLQTMTNTKLKTAVVAAAVLSVPIFLQQVENSRLREALSSAQQQRGIFARNAGTHNGALSSDELVSISYHGHAGRDLSALGSNAGDQPDARHVPAARDWEHVLFIADPLQRTQRLSQLLAALTPESAPQIAAAFDRVKEAGIKFSDEQRLFLRAWGKLDGEAAVNYAVNHGGEGSDEAIAALGGWAAADPQQAKTWLDALPESEAKETLIYGLLDGWSTIDFHAAAAYAESRPGSPARDRFRELLLQRALRSGGISAAQSWVDHMPDNDDNRKYKQRAFADVVKAMLYRDPAAAARWISESSGQAFVGSDAVANTAAKLAETSPTDAISWLTTIESTGTKNIEHGAGSVLQTWAKQNPEAAGAWLQQNSNHQYYDQMVMSYATTVAPVDRNAANAWAQTIRRAELRSAALATMESKHQISYDVVMIETNFAATSTGGFVSEGVTTGLNANTAVLQYVTQKGEASQRTTHGASFGDVSGSLAIQPSPKNPHGNGAQWSNCASCHIQ